MRLLVWYEQSPDQKINNRCGVTENGPQITPGADSVFVRLSLQLSSSCCSSWQKRVLRRDSNITGPSRPVVLVQRSQLPVLCSLEYEKLAIMSYYVDSQPLHPCKLRNEHPWLIITGKLWEAACVFLDLPQQICMEDHTTSHSHINKCCNRSC